MVKLDQQTSIICNRCKKDNAEEGKKLCNNCNEYNRNWYKNLSVDKKTIRRQQKNQYRYNNKEKCLIREHRYHDKLKHDVLYHYSNGTMRCACCGESIYEFLTIDHINNDGAEHLRQIFGRRHGSGLYRWLKTHDFPMGFQILCWNCNCAKGHFGHCPHTKKE